MAKEDIHDERWKVYFGPGCSSVHNGLKSAKRKARQYTYAQIVDVLGFVRYISVNGRIKPT